MDKIVKEINNFIQSYSSSIGVDGILLLTNIQRNIIYEQMISQFKHKDEQMMVQFKHKDEQMMVQFKHKNEIDYIKWSFTEGWFSISRIDRKTTLFHFSVSQRFSFGTFLPTSNQ